MKIMRWGNPGSERPAVLSDHAGEGEKTYDLSSLTADIDGSFLAAGGLARVREALDSGALAGIDLTGERIGAPIANPSAVIGIGLNYAAHAAESGADIPTHPLMFLKAPNTLAGPFDDTMIPRNSTTTDWEVELGVVIGQRASYLDSPADAPAHIAGFVTANDLSERDFQLKQSGGQWSKGKCAPGFSPLGPWLVPADEVDHTNLGLRTWVNGELRQDSSTADLIFGVDFLIHHLSQYMTLEAGDVVLTGTPQGVGLSGKYPYLAAGDVVEVEIDGLGRQRQQFTQWSGK